MELCQPLDSLNVEMVVMIVRDQDEMDGRQVFESQAWGHQPFGAGEADRARAFRPVRVCEDVQPLQLNEQCGMADPRDGRVPRIGAQQCAIVVHGHQRACARMHRRGPASREDEFPPLPFTRPAKPRVEIPEAVPGLTTPRQ